MDRCPTIIITTTQPTTTTPRRRDRRRSAAQMGRTSVMSKIKISSAWCAVTRAPASTTDSLRAKVSVESFNGFSSPADRRMKNPFNVINLRSPLSAQSWTRWRMQFEVHLNNFSLASPCLMTWDRFRSKCQKSSINLAKPDFEEKTTKNSFNNLFKYHTLSEFIKHRGRKHVVRHRDGIMMLIIEASLWIWKILSPRLENILKNINGNVYGKRRNNFSWNSSNVELITKLWLEIL